MPQTRQKPAKQLHPDETVGVNVELPVAIHRRLRIRCIEERLTLAEAITAAVKEWTR